MLLCWKTSTGKIAQVHPSAQSRLAWYSFVCNLWFFSEAATSCGDRKGPDHTQTMVGFTEWSCTTYTIGTVTGSYIAMFKVTKISFLFKITYHWFLTKINSVTHFLEPRFFLKVDPKKILELVKGFLSSI